MSHNHSVELCPNSGHCPVIDVRGKGPVIEPGCVVSEPVPVESDVE